MKTILTSICALAAVTVMAQDGFTNLWSSGFANGGNVPDGNPTGWFDTRTISGFANYTNSDVNVTLTLSGGFNGDLYAYLVHDNNLVVLLNRVGLSSSNAFGYSDAGLSLRLDDQAANTTDIHHYQSVVGWTISGGATWRPDGRNISPASSGLTFDTALRQNSGNPLGLLNGTGADGTWTLFLADLSGGGHFTVLNWGLEVTVGSLPEPSPIALSLLGGFVLLAARWRAKAKTG